MPYLDELPWQAARDYFRSNDCVMIGTGAIHAHDHIPSGIDNLTTNHIMREVEKRTEILIVGTIPFGPMPEYSDYPGTISVSSSTFIQVVMEIVGDLMRSGARKFLFVNGHGGNTVPLEEIGYRIRSKGGIAPVLEWWRMIKEINPELAASVGKVPANATKGRRAKTRGDETAAAMFLAPRSMPAGSVRIIYSKNILGDALPTNYFRGVVYKGVTLPMRMMTMETTEYGEEGTGATVERGQQMLEEVVTYIVDFIGTLRSTKIP
jgi:creatinine amidohydrolase